MSNFRISFPGTHLFSFAVLLIAPWGYADTSEPHIPEDLDISKWECKYCVFEEGFSGQFELGVGQVSERSAKFGEYNGLYEDGPFAVVNGYGRYRNLEGDYLDFTLRNLGLESRDLSVAGGRQGRYEIELGYDELTHVKALGVLTPYQGVGSAQLTLPASWQPIGSTVDIDRNTLDNIDLISKRQRVDVGALFIPAKHWETSVDIRHEVRSGEQRTAGAFFFNSAELAGPVDYVTDEIELAANYTTRNWQSRLSLFASYFSNDNDSLQWQNAFGPIVPGADTGEMALAPDNQFQQLRFTSGYQLGQTRFYGDIAYGQMRQDVDFLAATLNPNLVVELPASSPEAKVDTLNANFRINSSITRKFQIKAAYRLDDRDNQSDSLMYSWVSSDAFVNPVSRRNLPYSFRTEKVELEGMYRLESNIKWFLGYSLEDRERTHQEVSSTEESQAWSKLRLRLGSAMQFDFRFAKSERDADGYQPVDAITPGQNPLLRKYYMADRNRYDGHASATFFIHEQVSLDLSVESSNEDYTDSPLGLTEARNLTQNLDISVTFTDNLDGHLFATLEKIESKQNGSSSFSTSDWTARNKDLVDTFGAGLNYHVKNNKMRFGADFLLSDATGEQWLQTYQPEEAYPETSSRLQSLSLYAEFQFSESLSLHAEYLMEEYESELWAQDGVGYDTLGNLISLGYPEDDYDVQVVSISARYRF